MLNKKDLLVGTREEISGQILTTAGDGFDGYEIMSYKGMVWGISMRARDSVQDCFMGCKNITGGELTSYTELSDESRQNALDRMLQMAARLGANAVIDFRFDFNIGVQGAAEVTAHGTGVIIKPIGNYVPVGAVGNILAAMSGGNGVSFTSSSSSKKDAFGDFSFTSDTKNNNTNAPVPPVPGQNSNEQMIAPPTKSSSEDNKYPIAKVIKKEDKFLAKCPSCSAVFNVTSIMGDDLQDYDLEEDGQQVRCSKCENIFTILD